MQASCVQRHTVAPTVWWFRGLSADFDQVRVRALNGVSNQKLSELVGMLLLKVTQSGYRICKLTYTSIFLLLHNNFWHLTFHFDSYYIVHLQDVHLCMGKAKDLELTVSILNCQTQQLNLKLLYLSGLFLRYFDTM